MVIEYSIMEDMLREFNAFEQAPEHHSGIKEHTISSLSWLVAR
jgi:hypothetical protein